jgi:hypothetical protein
MVKIPCRSGRAQARHGINCHNLSQYYDVHRVFIFLNIRVKIILSCQGIPLASSNFYFLNSLKLASKLLIIYCKCK